MAIQAALEDSGGIAESLAHDYPPQCEHRQSQGIITIISVFIMFLLCNELPFDGMSSLLVHVLIGTGGGGLSIHIVGRDHNCSLSNGRKDRRGGWC